MIKQLAHVCIHTDDLAAAERFYCETLGLRKAFDFRRGEALFGFYVDLGNGTFIEVFQGAAVDSAGAIKHMCIEVDELDAVIAALTAGGYDVTAKKKGCDQSWQAWVTDPGGARIEFHEYTDDSAQRTGETVHVNW